MERPVKNPLTKAAWMACVDCGWSHMTEFAWWRKSLNEALETMSVADLKRVLDAWNAAEPGDRPPRRELWYRGKRWRKSSAFVERALGRVELSGNAVAFPMDGGTRGAA